MFWTSLFVLCLAGTSLASSKCWNSIRRHETPDINPQMLRYYDEQPPELVLTGPFYQMGDFIECLSEPDAQYCLAEVYLGPHNETSQLWKKIQASNSIRTHFRRDLLYIGLCAPVNCTHLEIVGDYEDYLTSAAENLGVTVNVTIRQENCQSKQRIPFRMADYVAGYLLASILLIVLLATGYDLLRRTCIFEKQVHLKGDKFLICFSLLNNWQRLGKISDNEESKSLAGIHGLRTLSMYLVVTGHVLYTLIQSPLQNPEFIEEAYHDIFTSGLINGHATMATFFCISGFLLAYFFLKEADKKGTVTIYDILKIIAHRYIRLTPVYALVILLQATLFEHLGRGPFWYNIIGTQAENCRHNWWTNLLYVNNYISADKPCLTHAWYLAADFQNYIVALLVLIPIWKYPRHAKKIMAVVLMFWIVVSFVQTYVERLSPALLMNPETIKHTSKDVDFVRSYITFQNNAGAYFVGVIFGYIFYNARCNGVTFSKKLFVFVWIIILFLPWTFLVSPYFFYQPSFSYNVLTASIYASISKVLFSAGIGTTILTFALGYGCIGNVVASWRPFQIFGRLTYSLYLIHACVLEMEAAATMKPLYVTEYKIARSAFGDFIITTLAALMMSLAIELPVSALTKIFGNSAHLEKQKKVDNNNILTSDVLLTNTKDERLAKTLLDVTLYNYTSNTSQL